MGFGSMYVGSTGMKAHSTWMQVVGNNLANVNTTGYKHSRTFFETLASQTVPGGRLNTDGSVQSAGQVGKGVGIADIQINTRQGNFEDGSYTTDLAIGGQGYFAVSDTENNRLFYTRAGNFRFDKDGQLLDPHGYNLMGFSVDRDTGVEATTATNIRLPIKEMTIDGRTMNVIRSDPRATTGFTMLANLDSGVADRTNQAATPFFSLLQAWDGTSAEPLSTDEYAYNSKIDVYDSEGNKRQLTVYFDKASAKEEPGGRKYWEYIVTSAPGEDGRGVSGPGAGVVMMGTMTFNSAGEMENMSAFTLSNPSGDPKDLNNWSLAQLSTEGRPQFDMVFKTSGGASAPQTVSVDFGMYSPEAAWSNPGMTAAALADDAAALPQLVDGQREALAMTDFSGSSVTLTQYQDGYAEGFLNNISVTQDGMLTGHFSNGQSEALFRVALFDFTNEYGLRREGGNLFSATPDSGEILTGKPHQGSMGKLFQKTLETSNVSMEEEFSRMILGQRGFQANSKVVSTSDTMLSTLLQVKR